MNLKNKKVLVFGMGDSGRAAAKLLQEKEAHVSFYDDDLRYLGAVGFEKEPLSKHWDLVVVSPGVKVKGNALLQELSARSKVISELDLGYLFCRGRIVAVTGTNGKTTVCMLVNKILKIAGVDSVLCGNIGLPFSSVCDRAKKNTVMVVEVSSFQLETCQIFRCDEACVLNVQPDHLDRHGSLQEYANVKRKLTQSLRWRGRCVLNLDDDFSKKMGGKKNIYFSKKTMKKGAYVKNEAVFFGKSAVLGLKDIPLRGEKNLENVLAAVAICADIGVPLECIREGVQNFSPAAHRMQVLGMVDGVVWVDDSKATNVGSSIACLQAFEGHSIFLMLGGMGKAAGYDALFERGFAIKCVVAFGQDGQEIERCAKKFAYPCQRFASMEEAVDFCWKSAGEGDVVLLSPACSSFDEFSSYAERGDVFAQLVFKQRNLN